MLPIELFERYGRDTIRGCMDAIMDQSETRMRARIREIADGTYRFADYMDDCGPGTPPIKMAVAITVDGDSMLIDWDGTDPQTDSPTSVNLPRQSPCRRRRTPVTPNHHVRLIP